MAKKTTRAEENIQAVEEVLSKSEQFIEDNQKPILIVVGIIILIILVYFGFQRFYLIPKEKSAQEQIFMAEKYFEMDSLDLALTGDGLNLGFLEIIDDYKFTKTASLAHFYAGIIYMKKGDYQTAIDYLENFDGGDQIVASMGLGAIGDCLMELDKPENAAEYYLKAANDDENEFTSPLFLMKAGWTYESMKDYKKALKVYSQIKEEFPQSTEAREMDKYIARVKGYLNK
nr:tetratricopeptide repeat protein [Bacteroidota bacterium]